jgi:hypothetical protein
VIPPAKVGFWNIADDVLAALRVRYWVSSSGASYFDECPNRRIENTANDDAFHLIEADLVAPTVVKLFCAGRGMFTILGPLL